MRLVDNEQYSVAFTNISEGKQFELDVTDNVMLYGFAPDYDSKQDLEDVFRGLLPSGLAYAYIDIAWRHKSLDYVILANRVLVAFSTPLGWSALPPNSYAVGSLPTNTWKQTYELVDPVIEQLIFNPEQQQGETNGH